MEGLNMELTFFKKSWLVLWGKVDCTKQATVNILSSCFHSQG